MAKPRLALTSIGLFMLVLWFHRLAFGKSAQIVPESHVLVSVFDVFVVEDHPPEFFSLIDEF
jgi:hypothetical protein